MSVYQFWKNLHDADSSWYKKAITAGRWTAEEAMQPAIARF